MSKIANRAKSRQRKVMKRRLKEVLQRIADELQGFLVACYSNHCQMLGDAEIIPVSKYGLQPKLPRGWEIYDKVFHDMADARRVQDAHIAICRGANYTRGVYALERLEAK